MGGLKYAKALEYDYFLEYDIRNCDGALPGCAAMNVRPGGS
jgi:hypothetical protein